MLYSWCKKRVSFIIILTIFLTKCKPNAFDKNIAVLIRHTHILHVDYLFSYCGLVAKSETLCHICLYVGPKLKRV